MRPKDARRFDYRGIRLAIGALSLAITAACASSTKAPENWDGLKLVKHEGLDLVYVRPGARLVDYRKVMIDPLEVSFDKNWKPEQDEMLSTHGIDLEKIRQELAQAFHEISRTELEQEGHYPLVEETGSDVLRVRPAIVNLYISAPDTMEPGNFTLVAESGSMTLIAELRDSLTNTLLARVVDREESTDTGRMQIANSVTNSADARLAIGKWADALRTAMDNAHRQVALAPSTAPLAQGRQ